jgi:hypothetical protein
MRVYALFTGEQFLQKQNPIDAKRCAGDIAASNPKPRLPFEMSVVTIGH